MMKAGGGALFRRDKKTGNQPDWTGDLEITRDAVRALVDDAQNGRELKLKIAAWQKTGPKAGTFFGISLSYNDEQDQDRNAGRQETQGRSSDGRNNFDDDIPF